MAATMKDIAKHSGLGLATVSSYFNGGNVREKNRIKIEQAIRELHYEVNEVARSLKTNETKAIGVVIPELNQVFCAQIITSMEDVLRSQGYATIVCDCRTDRRLEREAVEFLYQKRVDGIVNMPVDVTGSHLELFQKAAKPIVLIDRKIEGWDCDCVLVDNQKAAQDAVKLLISHGHTNIGIILGPREVFTAQERLKGYCDALWEAGIAFREDLVGYGNYTIAGGVSAMKNLIRKHPEMTAVFITNDEMTMGAIIGMNELGIRIPEQLSVMGFDNLSLARACRPSLSIISQPTAQIGREAAKMLLNHLKNHGKTACTKKLPAQIHMGNSICLRHKNMAPG